MNLILLSITSIFSFLITWIFFKIFIPNVSKKLIAKPNKRSSHIIPTPQGGGIIFLIVGSISSLFVGNTSLVISCIPIGLIGLLDDFYKVKPLIRYIVQFATVLFLIDNQGIPSYGFSVNSNILDFCILFLLTIFLTAIINFVNFMDGIDGLVSLTFIIFLFVATINISISFLPLMIMLLGFICWNWNPAKIFMGDVGSTFLGAITVGILLQKDTLINSFFLLIVLTPLLIDAFSCLIKRLITHQNIFKPHKLHLYQRLNQAGWSHSKISLIYGSGSFILSLLFLFSKYDLLLFTAFFEIFIGMILDKKCAISFNTKLKDYN